MKFDGSMHGDLFSSVISYKVWKDKDGEGAALWIGTDDPYDDNGFVVTLSDTEEGLREIAKMLMRAADWYRDNKRLEKQKRK